MIHERTDKLDFIGIKNVCSVKDKVKRITRKMIRIISQRLQKNICKRHIDKGLYQKHTKKKKKKL